MTQSLVPVADSNTSGNTGAAPGSGTNFVSLATTPPAGAYRVNIIYEITGAVEVKPLNVRLKVNGLTYCQLPSGGGVNAVQNFTFEKLTLDGVNTIALAADTAATASTVYTGTISATRIG